MIINRKYTYASLEQVTFENGSRYYVSPENNHLSSVTTILSATADKPELEAWKKRVGLTEAEKIRTEATNIGSLMHENLEKHILGEERPKGNNLIRVLSRNMANTIIDNGLKNVSEVWAIEQVLYIENKYAGTADGIGIIGDKPSIFDFKTTKKPKTKAQIEDYFCQLIAYALAHNEVHGTDIKKGVIYMCSRDCYYQEFVLEGNEFDTYQDIWLRRLDKFLNDNLK